MNPKLKNNFFIGIAGEHQVGKDTVAEYLRNLFSYDRITAIIYSLGTPLKKDIAELTGGSEKIIEQNKNDARLRWLLEKYGMEYPHEKNLIVSLRKEISLYKETVILVPGVRTIAEANFIREISNGLIIRIRRVYSEDRRPVYKEEDFPSERELNRISYDYPIMNDATLIRLENYVSDFYNNFLPIQKKWKANLLT